jgi:hypothetical protein
LGLFGQMALEMPEFASAPLLENDMFACSLGLAKAYILTSELAAT